MTSGPLKSGAYCNPLNPLASYKGNGFLCLGGKGLYNGTLMINLPRIFV